MKPFMTGANCRPVMFMATPMAWPWTHKASSHQTYRGRGCKNYDAVVVYDADGKFVRSWGKEYKGGAHGLHLSREGNEEFFYICDIKRHMFAKHTHEGKELWRKWAPKIGQDIPGRTISVLPT